MLAFLSSAALAQAPPLLDQLLAALKVAPSEDIAANLEQRIREAWLNAGSPAVTLLMSRGLRDAQAGAQQEAEADFDAAIVLDPNLAEAYDRRAVTRFQQGDYAGAVRDIEEALKREPRDFIALQDLSRIAESRHDWAGAYAAWQKVLELDPKTPGGEMRLNELRRHAEGEGI
ncbi:MAG: tetratricopeptide repeat protein [Acidisphaera sp.]|nr:tetratricopeptide repeat protein [Acidisphaera sp.]